jgi:hypothetical protein
MESGCKWSFFHGACDVSARKKKVKRLVRLFRRTCAIESVFWKTPCRLFLPSLPNLVQCSSINRIGKENSSDLASSFTVCYPTSGLPSCIDRYWTQKNSMVCQQYRCYPVFTHILRPGVGNFNSMYLNQS